MSSAVPILLGLEYYVDSEYRSTLRPLLLPAYHSYYLANSYHSYNTRLFGHRSTQPWHPWGGHTPTLRRLGTFKCPRPVYDRE